MPPSNADAAPLHFSLVRGGPFYALARKTRLARDDDGDIARLSIASAAFTWGVMAVIAAAERVVTGRWSPLIDDLAVHVRLLVGVPLLFIGDRWLDIQTVTCLRRFVGGHFADEAAVTSVVARASRMRDSRVPEAVALALAIAVSQALYWKLAPETGLLHPDAVAFGRSPVMVWYGFVALPLTQFLFARCVWRWFIWSHLLFRLSRLGLRLVAIHPDRRGGIGFISEPMIGFAPAAAAFTAVQAGVWGTQILAKGISFRTFATPFSVMVMVALLVLLGPLMTWSVPLWSTRHSGETNYTKLAMEYVRRFEHRWIEEGRTEGLLGTSDIQSLADLSNSFAIVRDMRLVPFDARTVGIILLAMATPIFPLVLHEVPLGELLREVLSGAMGLR